MELTKYVENVLRENNIKYFKGSEDNENILNLPYHGIKDKSNHIYIYLDINEEIQNLKFSFIEKYNESISVEEIKSQLLDINYSLQFGSLAMQKNSNKIEYRVDYTINDGDDFTFKQYNLYIVRCVKVYEMLKEKNII